METELRGYLKDACEQIDAAIFSGDVLSSEAETEALKAYMERWMRAIEQYKVRT